MKMLSVVAVLVLVSGAVLGDPLTQECRAIWQKYENTQVKFLARQAGIRTEEECKSTCENGDNCWNIDFNFKDNSCWHGAEHKPTSRTPDSSVHHWDLTKECKDFEIVKTDCVLSWEPYYKTQVVGLTQQATIQTEADCNAVCETRDDCWNIDFNYNDNSCWFGSVHKPTGRSPDDQVNHWDLSKDCTVALPADGEDCGAILSAQPSAKSGVYSISTPGHSSPVKVYCDMETSGGGWTLFQRRKDGSEKFERNWDDYANGFGDITSEFWLGNDDLTALTNARSYRLRVDLVDFDGVHTYAEYNNFKMAGADDKYRLSYDGCSYFGTAGDALGGATHLPAQSHNGVRFSTVDQDNDNNPTEFCAKSYHGGWWYNQCHSANLNGLYGQDVVATQGLNWVKWSKNFKVTEMKLRAA